MADCENHKTGMRNPCLVYLKWVKLLCRKRTEVLEVVLIVNFKLECPFAFES